MAESKRKIEQELLGLLSDIEIDETNPNLIRATLVPESDFPAFQGHFPGHPLLPAAVQLAAVRLVCMKAKKTGLILRSAGKSKFSGMIRPGDKITISVELTGSESSLHAEYVIQNKDDKVAIGSLEFTVSAHRAPNIDAIRASGILDV